MDAVEAARVLQHGRIASRLHVVQDLTHALLDGFHEHFMEATNPDVLAFHEAFADIVALVLCLAATVRAFQKVHPPAACLLLPYLAWVSFAAFLNFTIMRLNP